jgi:trehalose 6-phosphate phosphatase
VKDILSRANRQVLARFSRVDVLLAFDFDGTLARIVRDPAAAAMRASTRALLATLAERQPCVVISGRRRSDVARRVRGVRVAEVVGNHGIEPSLVGARIRREVQRWAPILDARLTGMPGVRIEDKGYSVAVHYRLSVERARARTAIRAAAAALGPVRVVAGKQVLNLLPTGAPNKGAAFEEALARFGCDAAVYVGDDTTDEDVFALGQPSRLLMIRVGRARESLAPYFIRAQAEIDELLRRLVAGRRATARPGSPAPRAGSSKPTRKHTRNS